jgi:hypothetical protein
MTHIALDGNATPMTHIYSYATQCVIVRRLLLKRGNRFTVLLTDEETEKLQDFRWKNRLESKADAARRLIAKGLEAENVRSGEAA